MKYIIAQVFGIIAFTISLSAYHRNEKSKILNNMLISNVFNLIHYLLLGAYSGCVTKVIAITRDTFIVQKEKNKKLDQIGYLYVFICIYIIAAIFTYKSIWSIFPLLAALIYLISIWNGDKKTVKETALFCYFLWLVYNIFVFSIAGIVSNVISIISTLIAVINERKNNKKTK